jgi:peptidoglycan/xylan/chitin deacetylase (PgdA/CDA1 family)
MLLTMLGLAAAGGAAAAAHGAFHPRSRLWAQPRFRADSPGARAVALTFDDGPDPRSTEPILRLLEQRGLRGAFFMIGRFAAEHPRITRRAHEAGHLLCNHSYDHHATGMFGHERYWLNQIDRTNDVLRRVSGVEPRFFRPPMGFKHPFMARALRKRGMTMVTWACRGYDGTTTTESSVVERVARRVGPGDVVALHDGVSPQSRRDPMVSVRALEPVLDLLQSLGLAVVRLDELLGQTGRGGGQSAGR